MKNWLVYSPFSKHTLWNKLTDQLNRTNQVGTTRFSDIEYYVSINETEPTEGPKGVYLSSWSKQDYQFMLDMNRETKELIVIRPNSVDADNNPFKRELDTAQLAVWLEEYDWVAFGYIIAPEGIDRFQAMNRSIFYTRDTEGNFISLTESKMFTNECSQPAQHWFIATKASDDLNLIFCHPDILIPNFGLEYQTDKNGDIYYTYLEENFDYFNIALKPASTHGKIIDNVIYSTNKFIDLNWSQGSHVALNIDSRIGPVSPVSISTNLAYTTTDTGISVENKKGTITLKYNVTSLLGPSMKVNELGTIEKTYLILGE